MSLPPSRNVTSTASVLERVRQHSPAACWKLDTNCAHGNIPIGKNEQNSKKHHVVSVLNHRYPAHVFQQHTWSRTITGTLRSSHSAVTRHYPSLRSRRWISSVAAVHNWTCVGNLTALGWKRQRVQSSQIWLLLQHKQQHVSMSTRAQSGSWCVRAKVRSEEGQWLRRHEHIQPDNLPDRREGTVRLQWILVSPRCSWVRVVMLITRRRVNDLTRSQEIRQRRKGSNVQGFYKQSESTRATAQTSTATCNATALTEWLTLEDLGPLQRGPTGRLQTLEPSCDTTVLLHDTFWPFHTGLRTHVDPSRSESGFVEATHRYGPEPIHNCTAVHNWSGNPDFIVRCGSLTTVLKSFFTALSGCALMFNWSHLQSLQSVVSVGRLI